MKKILYTQRVEIISSYGERRDCADQRLAEFLFTCGYLPVPVPNVPKIAEVMLQEGEIQGIFLSGGNNLVQYGGDAPERDETERLLVTKAIERGLPVFGICRGMQFILAYFDVPLVVVENHVATHHRVDGQLHRTQVNSFHTMGAKKLNSCLLKLGCAEDGVIEAVRHVTASVAGVMWHPEREEKFLVEDIKIIQNFFK